MTPLESTNEPRPPEEAAGGCEIVLQIGAIAEEDLTAFVRVLAQAAVAEVISKWGLDERSDRCDSADQTLEKGPVSACDTDEAKEQVV